MNKNEIIEGIKNQSIQFKDLDDIYKNDKKIVLAAFKKDVRALQFASKELQNDKTIVLEAINQNGNFYQRNVEEVAYAQTRSENSLNHMVNKIMICDTDVITTMVWSEILFGNYPKILDSLVTNNYYDMTFLFDYNTPWIEDEHRKFTDNLNSDFMRIEFFNKMKEKLILFKRPYLIINGNYNDRYIKTLEYINNLINI